MSENTPKYKCPVCGSFIIEVRGSKSYTYDNEHNTTYYDEEFVTIEDITCGICGYSEEGDEMREGEWDE